MTQLTVNGQARCFPLPGPTAGNDQAGKNSAGPASAETRLTPVPMTVTQLLEHMGLLGKRIAVERNGEIVPRSTFDQPLLVDGDRLEIVVAVGGG